MKRCSYCGQENPDDATVCRIDQTPLDPENAVRAAKPSAPEIRVHSGARPLTVKLAVALLVADEVADFVHAAVGHHSFPSHDFDSNVITISASLFRFCLPPLFIYFVFRGYNWARWTMLFVSVLGLITEPWSLNNLQLDGKICMNSIVDVAAMVLLFQRASSRWYKRPKAPSAQPEPAS